MAMKSFHKYLPVYQEALGRYEMEHPHWRTEVLVSLIKWSLRSLQHYIEDAKDSEISWSSPFVELHYPIDWNWKNPGTGEIASGGHIFGEFNAKNTATKKLAVKTLSQTMARQFNAMMMAEVTNWAWFEIQKNGSNPVFPIETNVALDAIKNKQKRREVFEELIRPFSIGAARVDLDDKKKSGAKVSKRTIEQLGRVDIAGIRFTGDVNGRKFDMGLFFEIHPLIADYNQKKAYHPVVVGLAVLNANPRLVGGEVVMDTPAEWSKKDRGEFWGGLLREIDKLTGQLISKPENQESVIISVNSVLKIPMEHWKPENRSATIKRFSDLNACGGDLEGINVQATGELPLRSGQRVCAVCGWVHDVGFTQIQTSQGALISLGGILPDIVGLVHGAHENGFSALSSKDEKLLKICGGYRNPCKAFDDLKRQREYKLLFDTRKRGFISLRGALGMIRNKSESTPE